MLGERRIKPHKESLVGTSVERNGKQENETGERLGVHE